MRSTVQDAAVHVLFVSRRNTARSILADACLNALSKGRMQAFSCGSPQHVGRAPHPSALQALAKAGFATPQGPCKSWDFIARGPRRMDFVITLAEDMEVEVPRWPGQPETALWAYPDMVLTGDLGGDVYEGMLQTLYSLRRRLELLVSLPIRGVDRSDLRKDLRDLGYMR